MLAFGSRGRRGDRVSNTGFGRVVGEGEDAKASLAWDVNVCLSCCSCLCDGFAGCSSGADRAFG